MALLMLLLLGITCLYLQLVSAENCANIAEFSTGTTPGYCDCKPGYQVLGTGERNMTCEEYTCPDVCVLSSCPVGADNGPNCACSVGYTETIAVTWDQDAVAWTGVCDIIACPNAGIHPNCTCYEFWEGGQWNDLTESWDSCSAAPCYEHASGVPGTCTCDLTEHPATGIVWDMEAQVYIGECSECPENALNNGTSTDCYCAPGYTLSGTTYDFKGNMVDNVLGQCNPVSECPGGSVGAPNCACPSGYTSTIQWVHENGTWVGDCMATSCTGDIDNMCTVTCTAPECTCQLGYVSVSPWGKTRTGLYWNPDVPSDVPEHAGRMGAYQGSCQPAECPLHYTEERVPGVTECFCYDGYNRTLFWEQGPFENPSETYTNSKCTIAKCPNNATPFPTIPEITSPIECICGAGYQSTIAWAIVDATSQTYGWVGNCILDTATCPPSSGAIEGSAPLCACETPGGTLAWDEDLQQWSGSCEVSSWKAQPTVVLETDEDVPIVNRRYNATENPDIAAILGSSLEQMQFVLDYETTYSLEGVQAMLPMTYPVVGNATHLSWTPPAGISMATSTQYLYFCYYYIHDTYTGTDSEKGIVYLKVNRVEDAPIAYPGVVEIMEDVGYVLIGLDAADEDTELDGLSFCLMKNLEFKGRLFKYDVTNPGTPSAEFTINTNDTDCDEVVDRYGTSTHLFWYLAPQDGSTVVGDDSFDEIDFMVWDSKHTLTPTGPETVEIFIEDVNDAPRLAGQEYLDFLNNSFTFIMPGEDGIKGTDDDITDALSFTINEDAAGLSIDLGKMVWDESKLQVKARLLNELKLGKLITGIGQVTMSADSRVPGSVQETTFDDTLTVIYTPSIDAYGVEVIMFEFKDKHGATGRANVTVTIKEANDLPVIVTPPTVQLSVLTYMDENINKNGDFSFQFNFEATDSDTEQLYVVAHKVHGKGRLWSRRATTTKISLKEFDDTCNMLTDWSVLDDSITKLMWGHEVTLADCTAAELAGESIYSYRSSRAMKRQIGFDGYLSDAFLVDVVFDNNAQDNQTVNFKCEDPIKDARYEEIGKAHGCGGGMLLEIAARTRVEHNATDKPCDSSPCLNNGICNDIPDPGTESDPSYELNFEYECECAEGFISDTCRFEDPCADEPCSVGLTCEPDIQLTEAIPVCVNQSLLEDTADSTAITVQSLMAQYRFYPMATYIFAVLQSFEDVQLYMQNDCELVYNHLDNPDRDTLGCPHPNPYASDENLYDIRSRMVQQTMAFEIACDLDTVNNVWSDGDVCKPCPIGGVCDQSGRYLPVNAYGYHESSSQPFVFLECEPHHACPQFSMECAEGYMESTKCGSCSKDYYKKQGECVKCEKGSDETQIIIIGIVVGMGGVGLLVLLATKGAFVFEVATVAATFFQTLYVLSEINLTWPEEAQAMFEELGMLNFNVDVMAIECKFPDVNNKQHFKMKYYVVQAFPIAILLGLIVTYMVYTFIVVLIRTRSSGFERALIRAYIMFLAFAYLPLISWAVRLFNCVPNEDGTQTLHSEPALECYEEWWDKMFPVGIGCCILYGLGIPFYFVSCLRDRPAFNLPPYQREIYINLEHCFRNKFVFNSTQRRDYEEAMRRWYATYSPLSSQYKYHAFYWELVILFRKTILTLAMVFASEFPLFQAGLAGLILFVAILFQEKYQPYFNKKINLLETVTLMVCMISLLFAIMLSGEQNFPPLMVSSVGFTIVVLVSISIVYIIYLVLKMIVQHRRSEDKPVHLYPEDSRTGKVLARSANEVEKAERAPPPVKKKDEKKKSVTKKKSMKKKSVKKSKGSKSLKKSSSKSSSKKLSKSKGSKQQLVRASSPGSSEEDEPSDDVDDASQDINTLHTLMEEDEGEGIDLELGDLEAMDDDTLAQLLAEGGEELNEAELQDLLNGADDLATEDMKSTEDSDSDTD